MDTVTNDEAEIGEEFEMERENGTASAAAVIKGKRRQRTALFLIAAVVITTVIAAVVFFALKTKPADDFFETTGETLVSLVGASQTKINIGLDEGMKIEARKVRIYLDRDKEKPYLDRELYPAMISGEYLDDFKDIGGGQLFKDISVKVVKSDEKSGDGSKKLLSVSFCTDGYFAPAAESRQGTGSSDAEGDDGSIAMQGDNTYMDICGYYTMKVMEGQTVLAEKSLKIAPYASFRTMEEIYSEVDAMYEKASGNPDIFVKKNVLATSTGGKDIPYLIISDSEKSVERWLEISRLAENSPQEVMDMAKAGELKDIRVPILISNIHSNEVAATDGIMNFAWRLVKGDALDYKYLTDFTEAGRTKSAEERGNVKDLNAPGAAAVRAMPELLTRIEGVNLLGTIYDNGDGRRASECISKRIEMDELYLSEVRSLTREQLLKDVFFVIVPTQNADGREGITREAANGYDLNRDAAFQTTAETAGMGELLGLYNPVSFIELHGMVKSFQIEPCTPPHNPNFEYDIISRRSFTGGQAFGIAAVANNKSYNSYQMPGRDGLYYTPIKADDGEYAKLWETWDDASVSYTPQMAMLHGTVAYTIELPAYNEETVTATTYGLIGHSDYVAKNKADYVANQAELFWRGKTNHNSNSMEEAGAWFVNVNDEMGAEVQLVRGTFDGEGENGNFYPECYLIALSGDGQKNINEAREMVGWLLRNDVEVSLSTVPFSADGISYPAGTAMVSMYQAKRSVANAALGRGYFNTTWPQLYSEATVNFPELRGFDAETLAENGVCDRLIDEGKFEGLSYEWWKRENSVETADFSGTQGEEVVIKNTSADAAGAVNKLLNEGKTVGFITDGQYEGSFICSYDSYKSVSSGYSISAVGVSKEACTAKKIERAPRVYLCGKPEENVKGYIYTSLRRSAYGYNYDAAALDIMGFSLADSREDADVMVSGSALTEAEYKAVMSGKPYLGHAGDYRGDVSAAINVFEKCGVTLGRLSGVRDLLTYVSYPEESLLTQSYSGKNDDLMYSTGGYYFSKIPDGAKALVATESKLPVEGFGYTAGAGGQSNDFFSNKIIAFEYSGEGEDGKEIDIALFASGLTGKVHQRDEFAYISNFAFSRVLGGEY